MYSTYFRIDTLGMVIASTVIDFAFVYVTADLLSIPDHFDADTLERRARVSRRTGLASESRTKIDAPYSGKAWTCHLAFVHVLTRRTVPRETGGTTSTSKIKTFDISLSP